MSAPLSPSETVAIELAHCVRDLLDAIDDGRALLTTAELASNEDEDVAAGAMLGRMLRMRDLADALARLETNTNTTRADLAVKCAIDAIAGELRAACDGELDFGALMETCAVAAWRSAMGYGGASVSAKTLVNAYLDALANRLADLPETTAHAAVMFCQANLPERFARAVGERARAGAYRIIRP